MYYIYSIEHSGWWKANSMGYTPDFLEAGKYLYDDAQKIVIDANRFRKTPNEILVHADELFVWKP